MSEEVMEQQKQDVWSRFEVGRMVPDCRLPSVDGRMISPSDFRERKNLAILYFDIERSEDWGILWEVARRNRQFADEDTQVLGVTMATRGEAEICLGDFKLPFPVLYNDQMTGPEAHAEQPHLLVADRFGEIQSLDALNAGNVDHVLDRAIEKLDLIELECPECGVPTWAI